MCIYLLCKDLIYIIKYGGTYYMSRKAKIIISIGDVVNVIIADKKQVHI